MIRQAAVTLVACIAFAVASTASAHDLRSQEPYRLIEPQPLGKLGCWAGRFMKYDEIIGYSAFGDLFLRSRNKGEYVILYPARAMIKSFGIFSSPRDFEQEVLHNASINDIVLRPQQIAMVAKLLGPLGQDEVYAPFRSAGKTVAPNYRKANVWDFMDNQALLTGVCG